MLVGRRLSGDVDLHLVIVLDVSHLRTALANQIPIAPLCDLELLVALPGMGDVAMAVHDDVVDDPLGLLHPRGAAGHSNLELLPGISVLWDLRDADLDAKLLLDLPNDLT